MPNNHELKIDTSVMTDKQRDELKADSERDAKLMSIAGSPIKPTICLDFDGVLHQYGAGWNGGALYDDPVVGAQEFCRYAMESFKIVIYSTRSESEEGRANMRAWLNKHNFPVGIELATRKPLAMIYIDDRALTFTGSWPSIDELKNFRTWQGQ